MRRIILLLVVAILLSGIWLLWRSSSSPHPSSATSGPTIVKAPVNFANHIFDPENPPSDMPQLAPGEVAVCDTNFLSNANVGGEAHWTDSTHGIVTVTSVSVNLQLDITIWVPINASEHVREHEQGHREISEHFYETADKLAAQIAAKYMGKKLEISGADLYAELSKSLKQMGAEITEEYSRELNPNPTQLRYDAITDHSRNDVSAKDAVNQALTEGAIASAKPPSSSSN